MVLLNIFKDMYVKKIWFNEKYFDQYISKNWQFDYIGLTKIANYVILSTS